MPFDFHCISEEEGTEGRNHILGMSDDAPDAGLVQSGLAFLTLVLFLLVIGQDFKEVTGAEKTDGQTSEELGGFWLRSDLVSSAASFRLNGADTEWQSKWQSDDGLEDGFGQEEREKSLVPEPLLGIIVSLEKLVPLRTETY